MMKNENLKNEKEKDKKLLGEGIKFEKVYYDISKLIGTLELPDYIEIKNTERVNKIAPTNNVPMF